MRMSCFVLCMLQHWCLVEQSLGSFMSSPCAWMLNDHSPHTPWRSCTHLSSAQPPALYGGVDSVANNRSSVPCFVLSGQEFDCARTYILGHGLFIQSGLLLSLCLHLHLTLCLLLHLVPTLTLPAARVTGWHWNSNPPRFSASPPLLVIPRLRLITTLR